MRPLRHFRLRFLAPAFLGDAEQSGQWRTPPMKSLLRQFWRMAWAAENGCRVAEMRKAEHALFGAAADGTGNRSALRLRLSDWSAGQLREWRPIGGALKHPEVPHPVAADIYLGYGPLPLKESRAAIDPGACAELRLALAPGVGRLDDEANAWRQIDTALAMMNLYGTLGGRSRNGWGSFELEPLGETQLAAGVPLTMPWKKALEQDWPTAIGSDESGPLVWATEPFPDWQQAMKRLAAIKIALRTSFPFESGDRSLAADERHWLAYPVTRHNVKPWGNDARLPNTLRFKLRQDGGDPTKLRGVVFHVPCAPPARPFKPELHTLIDVWDKAHAQLAQQGLRRVPA